MKTIICLIFSQAACVVYGYGSFETIQYPGATHTEAVGINGNIVVGRYWDAVQLQHGFLYDGITFTTLDFPGSPVTTVYDLSDNRIVGGYLDSLGARGFLYENGVFTTINPPGTSNLYANGSGVKGIDGSKIIGFYNSDGGGSALIHGYVYDGTTYTTIDYPGGSGSIAEDIEGNRIVGSYSGFQHGYYYDGTNFATIDDPLAGSLGTRATGIAGNTIVGYYYATPSSESGFIYQEGSYATFNVPSSLGRFTQIEGISGKTIVGSYQDSLGHYHGFVATIPEPSTCLLLVLASAILFSGRHRRYRG
jgi:hypothetical protein